MTIGLKFAGANGIIRLVNLPNERVGEVAAVDWIGVGWFAAVTSIEQRVAWVRSRGK